MFVYSQDIFSYLTKQNNYTDSFTFERARNQIIVWCKFSLPYFWYEICEEKIEAWFLLFICILFLKLICFIGRWDVGFVGPLLN